MDDGSGKGSPTRSFGASENELIEQKQNENTNTTELTKDTGLQKTQAPKNSATRGSHPSSSQLSHKEGPDTGQEPSYPIPSQLVSPPDPLIPHEPLADNHHGDWANVVPPTMVGEHAAQPGDGRRGVQAEWLGPQ